MDEEPRSNEHEIKVLLIDDQPMVGEAIRRLLAIDPNIVFSYCEDANQALEEAKRIRPMVILQDLVMPEIDGLSLVKLFREDAETREVPIIVLSTKDEPEVKAEAFALGANDYLIKLPDRLELIARILYHSKAYINLLQRNEAYAALVDSQGQQSHDVAHAAIAKTLLDSNT